MAIKKILLADDDADDREIFVRVLGQKHNVSLLNTFENGKEVIEYLETVNTPEQLPNLIILDHNMPKMNGTETLGRLKSDDRFSSYQCGYLLHLQR